MENRKTITGGELQTRLRRIAEDPTLAVEVLDTFLSNLLESYEETGVDVPDDVDDGIYGIDELRSRLTEEYSCFEAPATEREREGIPSFAIDRGGYAAAYEDIYKTLEAVELGYDTDCTPSAIWKVIPRKVREKNIILFKFVIGDPEDAAAKWMGCEWDDRIRMWVGRVSVEERLDPNDPLLQEKFAFAKVLSDAVSTAYWAAMDAAKKEKAQ